MAFILENLKLFAQAYLQTYIQGAWDSLIGTFSLVWVAWKQRQERNTRRSTIQESTHRNRGATHPNVKENEPALLNKVGLCSALNGAVLGISIAVFSYILLPVVQALPVLFGVASSENSNVAYADTIVQIIFTFCWIIPISALSRFINSFWFEDIANVSFRYSVGRQRGASGYQDYVADILFSFAIQLLFLIQTVLVIELNHLSPVVHLLSPSFCAGFCVNIFTSLVWTLQQVHYCILYSLYAFEYKWIRMGWHLSQRLAYIEMKWVYFVGFGAPLAFMTWLPANYYVSGCVFAVLFPFFIVSAYDAEPVTPASISSSRYAGVPFAVRRFPVFSIVVPVSDYILIIPQYVILLLRQSFFKQKPSIQSKANPPQTPSLKPHINSTSSSSAPKIQRRTIPTGKD